jgi:hypothetical protein
MPPRSLRHRVAIAGVVLVVGGLARGQQDVTAVALDPADGYADQRHYPGLVDYGTQIGQPANFAAAAPAPPAQPSSPAPAGVLSAAARLVKLKEKYGDGLQYEVDENLKLVFATGTGRKTLEDVRKALSAHASALQADLFATPLQDYVTVVLPREWKGSAQGFYNPVERSIIAKTPGAQLVHEFTHALHWDDMQAHGQFHQNWVIEGIATMCESCEIIEGHLMPKPNYRLKIIRRLVEGKHHVPWDTYVTWTQKQFMKAPGNHYSQAQSMMIYLHASGNLRPWYDAYVAGFDKDPTGAAAFENVFGKSLTEIEKDWSAWVLKQPLPKEAPRPAAAPISPANNPPPPPP